MDEFDLIAKLHEAAKDLLTQADELDRLASPRDASDDAITRIKEKLQQLCEGLGRVHTALSFPSALPELARRVNGLPIGDALKRVDKFIDEHRTAIQRLGLTDAARAIEMAVKQLQEVSKEGFAQSEAFGEAEVQKVLRIVGDFRDIVCRLSRTAEFAELLATPECLKAVAQGATGTAIVVIDVTGLMTVAPHDFTGWTLIKAVKSVSSGVSMVKRSWQKLSKLFGPSGSELPVPPPPPLPPSPPPPVPRALPPSKRLQEQIDTLKRGRKKGDAP